MKKPTKQVVSLTLAGSVLATSCSPPNPVSITDVTDANNGVQRAPQHSGSSSSEELLSSCLLPLSEQDKQLIALCINLMNDIMINKDVAIEFSNDPQGYFQSRGYEYTGSLDSGLIQLALAAADDDIRDAIERQDAKLFVDLCFQKGLLSLPSNLDASTGNISDDELNDFLSSHGYSLLNDNESLQQAEAEVAIEVVAVLYVAGVVVVASLVAVGVYIVICVDAPQEQKPMPTELSNISPLNLWVFNNSNDKYIPLDLWIETQYDLIDSILMEHIPIYRENSEYRNKLTHIIKANLLHYLL